MTSGHPSRSRIVVIPNGVEAEAFAGIGDREAIGRRWPECRGKRVALFLSRLHPLKGLGMLMDAWAATPHEGWQLLVVGADEAGHEAEIKARVERCGLTGSVTFGGPRYGDEKAAVMKAADLFVLPSHSENFGIVVAESLAAGVPVICTKGAPWKELVTERCGWWVEIGAEPLAGALREAMGLSEEERRAMGENGRRLVAERYGWERAAGEMEAFLRPYCDHSVVAIPRVKERAGEDGGRLRPPSGRNGEGKKEGG